MIFFPFVELEKEDLSLTNGIFFDAVDFCTQHFKSDRCQKFYKSLEETEKLSTCPYGFTCYTFEIKNKKFAITSFLVKNNYDQKKIKNKINHHFTKMISEDKFFEILNKNIEHLKFIEKHEEAKNEFISNDELIKSTMHEIRKLNRDIKSQSEELQYQIDNNYEINQLKYKAENIFGTSSLISIRLNAYDFIINPSVEIIDEVTLTPIYRKFEKVKHCLRNRCFNKSLKINLNGNTYYEMKAFKIFEVLPYVFLENAIKYSPNNHDINVNFLELNDYVEIFIDNMGPMIPDFEIKKIFENKYRPLIVREKFEGTGLGLFFAKKVCDLHKVKISASSENPAKYTVNNIQYSNFRITIIDSVNKYLNLLLFVLL